MSERKIFNEWLKYYEKHDVKIDQLQRAFMWQAWLASANREGYKLAPVEPTKEMLNCGYRVKHDKIIDLGNVYKAMIGVIK